MMKTYTMNKLNLTTKIEKLDNICNFLKISMLHVMHSIFVFQYAVDELCQRETNHPIIINKGSFFQEKQKSVPFSIFPKQFVPFFRFFSPKKMEFYDLYLTKEKLICT